MSKREAEGPNGDKFMGFGSDRYTGPEDVAVRATAAQLANRKIKDVRKRSSRSVTPLAGNTAPTNPFAFAAAAAHQNPFAAAAAPAPSFSFAATAPAPISFSSGATSSAQAFTFGDTTSSTTNNPFGATAAPSKPMSFGGTPSANNISAPNKPFSFDSQPSGANAAPSLFSFGSTPSSDSPVPSNPFGVSAPTAAPSKPFSFGSTSDSPSTNITFGAAAPTAASSQSLSFGSMAAPSPNSTSSQPFSFGTTSTAPTSFNFSGTESSTSSNPFTYDLSAPPPAQKNVSSTPGSVFGTNPATGSGSLFNPVNTGSSPTVFGASGNTQAPSFGASASFSQPTSMFGAPTPTSSTHPISFTNGTAAEKPAEAKQTEVTKPNPFTFSFGTTSTVEKPAETQQNAASGATKPLSFTFGTTPTNTEVKQSEASSTTPQPSLFNFKTSTPSDAKQDEAISSTKQPFSFASTSTTTTQKPAEAKQDETSSGAPKPNPFSFSTSTPSETKPDETSSGAPKPNPFSFSTSTPSETKPDEAVSSTKQHFSFDSTSTFQKPAEAKQDEASSTPKPNNFSFSLGPTSTSSEAKQAEASSNAPKPNPFSFSLGSISKPSESKQNDDSSGGLKLPSFGGDFNKLAEAKQDEATADSPKPPLFGSGLTTQPSNKFSVPANASSTQASVSTPDQPAEEKQDEAPSDSLKPPTFGVGITADKPAGVNQDESSSGGQKAVSFGSSIFSQSPATSFGVSDKTNSSNGTYSSKSFSQPPNPPGFRFPPKNVSDFTNGLLSKKPSSNVFANERRSFTKRASSVDKEQAEKSRSVTPSAESGNTSSTVINSVEVNDTNGSYVPSGLLVTNAKLASERIRDDFVVDPHTLFSPNRMEQYPPPPEDNDIRIPEKVYPDFVEDLDLTSEERDKLRMQWAVRSLNAGLREHLLSLSPDDHYFDNVVIVYAKVRMAMGAPLRWRGEESLFEGPEGQTHDNGKRKSTEVDREDGKRSKTFGNGKSTEVDCEDGIRPKIWEGSESQKRSENGKRKATEFEHDNGEESPQSNEKQQQKRPKMRGFCADFSSSESDEEETQVDEEAQERQRLKEVQDAALLQEQQRLNDLQDAADAADAVEAEKQKVEKKLQAEEEHRLYHAGLRAEKLARMAEDKYYFDQRHRGEEDHRQKEAEYRKNAQEDKQRLEVKALEEKRSEESRRILEDQKQWADLHDKQVLEKEDRAAKDLQEVEESRLRSMRHTKPQVDKDLPRPQEDTKRKADSFDQDNDENAERARRDAEEQRLKRSKMGLDGANDDAPTPTASKETPAQDGVNDEEQASGSVFDLSQATAGEEEEEVVFECRGRAFKVSQGWVSQGTGIVKVLKHPNGRSRLVLRAEPSGNVILNALLNKELKYPRTKNHVQLPVLRPDGGAEQWAIRVKAEVVEDFHSKLLEVIER